MRRICLLLAGTALLLALPTPALAQDSPTVIFGAYYRCNQGQEARADEIIRQAMGPIVQSHVDSGQLSGWAWLSHAQGGAWRRILAMTGSDLDGMLDARDEIIEEFLGSQADAAAELTSICASHDDYVWTSVASSLPDPNAIGPATLSAYHACDMSREARADEIFEQVLAPLYDKHQEMGHISSWGYYAHRVGGIFRRLETMAGADHKTLLAMQTAIYQEAGDSHPIEMQEMRSICSWHSDYLWDNAQQ